MPKKKRNTKQQNKQFYLRLTGIALIILVATIMLNAFQARSTSLSVFSHMTGLGDSTVKESALKPQLKEDFLTPNKFSRPQTKLRKVNAIVIHYVGNAGSTAQANRDYFEGLAETGETSASSHFVVGTDGEIIQCIPLDEISYASNNRNSDSISIEVCHPNKSGKFTNATYKSLEKLVSWLIDVYNLDKDNIIRHYDVTGKICPKYYVDHPDAWDKLKDDIWKYYEKNKD